MTPTDLIKRCLQLAMVDESVEINADSLIGFFQTFRPDGLALDGVFDGLPESDLLQSRLEVLFQVAGDDRRPQGGRDAYFVVRKPPAIDPGTVRELAGGWLAGLRSIAECLDDTAVMKTLDPIPKVRVLEGLAPKKPKREEDKSHLLNVITEDATRMLERRDTLESYSSALRPAYYFVACDPMLRDHLMWPLFRSGIAKQCAVSEPLKEYFELWKHGIKYRIFGNKQIDLYVPRQHDAGDS